MKATLEFTLPEEQAEHEAAVHALDWLDVVSELARTLRDRVKYQPTTKTNNHATVDAIRQQLFGLLEERGLTLD